MTSLVRPELEAANTAQPASAYSCAWRAASVCRTSGQPARRACIIACLAGKMRLEPSPVSSKRPAAAMRLATSPTSGAR